MKLFLDGHALRYEMGNLCFLFFPGEKIEDAQPGDETGTDYAVARLKRLKTRLCAFVTVCRGGNRKRAVEYAPLGEKEETVLGRAFYRAASELCGFQPPWGILTGIRPAKLVHEMTGRGLSPEQARHKLMEESLVSGSKAALCVETALREQQIISLSRPESFSLYISIPFCPTRCLYCSFISHDVQKSAKLLPEYVGLLCEEIRATGRTAAELGLRLETIYMGGGTPTSISAGDLTRIFDAVKASFDLGSLREFTVEAGRPDTITSDRLAAIKAGGAGRICINPQTLDDAILRRIGRSHDAARVYEAYSLARGSGIPSVNMDLIAGLPGDTPEGFEKTLGGIVRLRPEGVTVHTLAMKRASRLVTEGAALYDARGEAVSRMMDRTRGLLGGEGYAPYYLYRQRNTAGNLENVGYAIPGFECLYNVFIMDETHTVLSVGAGGVTKLRQPGGDRIERVFNFKYPYEYIRRFGEIIDRKKQVLTFYDEHNWKSENPGLPCQP